MPSTTLATWTKKFGRSLAALETRRPSHGSRAWSLPSSSSALLQPQDGAVEKHTRLAAIQAHLHSDLLREPEDATLTGGTRSLSRRLLGLNLGKSMRKGPAAITTLATQSRAA